MHRRRIVWDPEKRALGYVRKLTLLLWFVLQDHLLRFFHLSSWESLNETIFRCVCFRIVVILTCGMEMKTFSFFFFFFPIKDMTKYREDPRGPVEFHRNNEQKSVFPYFLTNGFVGLRSDRFLQWNMQLLWLEPGRLEERWELSTKFDFILWGRRCRK